MVSHRTRRFFCLKRYLTLLEEPEADRCTWKSIRRGRTTQLSCGNVEEDVIVKLGDWKKGFQKAYIDEDAVDRAVLGKEDSSSATDDADDSTN